MKLSIAGAVLLLLGMGASLAGCYVVDGDSRDESSQATDRNKVASVEPFHLTAGPDRASQGGCPPNENG